ncbi:MAG TPA: hypothetical protein VI258_12150 [Rhodanobacteraceae bacterium]
MKTRMSVIGATLATLFAASASASTHATDAAVSMTIDQTAPIRATLLPTVTLEATPATSETNPAKMTVADTAPLEVTLLPTVHVTAKQQATLATTLLPTVRVTPEATALLESMEVAERDASASLPVIDDASPSTTAEPLGLRAHAMPR